MRRIRFAGWMLLAVLAAAAPVQAGFALGDQDRVAFFGNKVLAVTDMPIGVETFIRIRYPELKTRFRTYARGAGHPSYRYSERVHAGVVLPETGVTYYDVPAEYGVREYRYTIVNDTPVIVEPRTRRVIEVIE